MNLVDWDENVMSIESFIELKDEHCTEKFIRFSVWTTFSEDRDVMTDTWFIYNFIQSFNVK